MPAPTPWLSPTPIHNSSLLGKYALLLPRHRHLDSLLSPWRTQTKTLSRQGPQTHNRDLSEETQDFRFLNSIINASNLTESTSIPKRGEKDFERDATKAQASVLDASRNVMLNALSLMPAQVKIHVVAQYCPEGARYESIMRMNCTFGRWGRVIARVGSSCC